MVAIFLYNILLIVLYSITLAFAINAYLKERKSFYSLVSISPFLFLITLSFI